MIHSAMRALRRPLAVATFSVGLGTLAGLAHPAMARVWVGFGFPLFVGPPAYYPPPVYYPPPAYYPPGLLSAAAVLPATGLCPPPQYRRQASRAWPAPRCARWNTRSRPARGATARRRRAVSGAAPPDGDAARRGPAGRGKGQSSRTGADRECRAVRGADRGLRADRRLSQRGAGQPRGIDRLAVLAALRQPGLLRRAGRHAGQRPLAHRTGRGPGHASAGSTVLAR